MKKIEFYQIQIEGYFYLNAQVLSEQLNEPIDETELVNTEINDIKPKILSELYLWKNGQDYEKQKINGYGQFCSWGYFLSFEEGLAFLEDKSNSDIIINGHFPFISSLDGDILFVNTKSKVGEVYLFSPSLLFDDIELVYDSLEAFFATINDCYEKGIFKFNDSDILEVDHDQEKTVSQKLNPKSKFWVE